MLDFLWGKGRESRQLNRDAPAIIESARKDYRSELLRGIALLVREQLADAHTVLAANPARRDELVRQLQAKHREARRRIQQLELTGYTLAIIYLRAEPLGEAAAPARDAIDEFLSQWEHAAPSEGA